jgi:hypothetical protein
VELQNELRHVLDVLIDEHGNVKMPSQSTIKSIVAYTKSIKAHIYETLYIFYEYFIIYPICLLDLRDV